MKQLPEKIALDKAVNGQRLYQGRIKLAHMTRLIDLLANTDGDVEYSISFSRARGLLGKAQIKINAGLPLTCTISQKEFMFQVEIDSVLGFIDDMAYEDLLDEDMEVSWVKEGFVIPLELIEDELILLVPDSPFDENNDSVSLDEQEILVVDKKPNPFEALKHLK